MKKKIVMPLICGMLGCVLLATGDWLMMYGDVSHSGDIYWLTEGVKAIGAGRNAASMLIAFPAIVLYSIALFSIEKLITVEKHRKTYHRLTIISLTPWLCLHLFYVMTLSSFAWLSNNGFESAAYPLAEALYSQFSWIVILSETIMIPPYIYWFYLIATNKSELPKAFCISNPLVIYSVLYIVKTIMPESPFRLGFTNGLMSEAIFLWFGSILIFCIVRSNQYRREKF